MLLACVKTCTTKLNEMAWSHTAFLCPFPFLHFSLLSCFPPHLPFVVLTQDFASQAGIELSVIFLSGLPKCWDYMYVLLHWAC